MSYTEKRVSYLLMLRDSGLSWVDVADQFNKKFKTNKSQEALRLRYKREKISSDIGHDTVDIDILQHNRSVRKTNFRLRKEANIALDALTIRSGIMEEIEKLLDKWHTEPLPKIEPKKTHDSQQSCILELLISDTHFGAKTKDYNFEVAKKRIQEVVKVTLFKIQEAEKSYKVDKIIVALLGDIIASYEFHGIASAVAAEAVTPVQIVHAIEILFWDLIYPLAATGYPIQIPAVCGNHDRVSKDKPMNEPGNESVSYIIYSTLEMLARNHDMDNVSFIIPHKSYCTVDVFGHNVLIEHGDRGMAMNRKSAEQKINDRQSQLKDIISFFRFGHFHEYAQYGWGRCIANPSLVGADGYSDNCGFATEAGQVLSCYVNTKNRSSPFYYSFLISVEDIK